MYRFLDVSFVRLVKARVLSVLMSPMHHWFLLFPKIRCFGPCVGMSSFAVFAFRFTNKS